MLTLGHLFNSLFGQTPPPANQYSVGPVEIDSRKIKSGGFFVAIRGGHQYLPQAFAAGATGALICRPVDFSGPIIDLEAADRYQQLEQHWSKPFCLRVNDTVLSLQKIAADWRSQFSPVVIGITGSIGKSSSKELVHSVLAQKFCTLKNEGSLNNEIGLPLTLTRLNETHQQVVLEMGMYTTGEIKTLCRIAKPKIGLVTNVGPSHLARAGSIERIVQAKGELVEALDEDGLAILNLDDERVAAMARQTKAPVFYYGLSQQADLWADQIISRGLEGLQFVLHYQNEAIPVQIPLLGRHNVYTALAAASVGLTQGLDWAEILAGLQNPAAKLRLIAVPGLNESLILDDTYNSSAESSKAALHLLRELEAERKIAVLGDMAELGPLEEVGHRQVGRQAAEVVDLLVTVGSISILIAEEAVACGLARSAAVCLQDTTAACSYLKEIIRPNDAVLIKGSRSMAMESIVKQLSATPETHNE